MRMIATDPVCPQTRTWLGMFGFRLGTACVAAVLLGPLESARAENDQPAKADPSTGPSNEDCLGCHSNPVDRSHGPAIPAVGETFADSVHGQISLSCVDCHVDQQGKDLPHEDKLPKPTCVPCHEEAVETYGSSIHASAREHSADSDAAWCSNCHGTHDIRSAKDPKSPTYHFNLAATCGKCHGNQAVIAKAGIKVGNVPAHFQDSIHGHALRELGLLVAPTCSNCHGNHEIRRASDEKSPVNRSQVAKTCGTCHEGVRRAYQASVHGAAVQAGNPRAAVCSDCHTAHEQQATDEKFKATLVKQCGTCHQEASRTFHGVSAKGVAATCADCHGSHDILPKADPQSLVSEQRRAYTCQRCHAPGSVAISPYNPHLESARPRPRHARRLAMSVAPAAVVCLAGIYLVSRRRRRSQSARDRR